MISFIITSKNEPYLQRTIEDIEQKAETDIEIIAEEDTGIGQRAMLNRLARKAKGDILCKVDAHCIFGKGFDAILLEDFTDNTIMAPYLMVVDEESWTVRMDKKSSAYAFNTQLAVDYHYEAENKEMLNETMCMQGSFFMVSKENYWRWNLCDESLGSWGHQGAELGVQAFLNGGRCVTSKKTYYGHLFRHKPEDFPYERDQKEIDTTHDLFLKRFKNKSLIPIIEKWNYPLDWTKQEISMV